MSGGANIVCRPNLHANSTEYLVPISKPSNNEIPTMSKSDIGIMTCQNIETMRSEHIYEEAS